MVMVMVVTGAKWVMRWEAATMSVATVVGLSVLVMAARVGAVALAVGARVVTAAVRWRMAAAKN